MARLFLSFFEDDFLDGLLSALGRNQQVEMLSPFDNNSLLRLSAGAADTSSGIEQRHVGVRFDDISSGGQSDILEHARLTG